MIIQFGAKNFFCFREGVEISFELSEKCPKNISHGLKFSTVLGVKGANGSGKTNLLKILAFFKAFLCHSFQNKPEGNLGTQPFFDCEDGSEFFIEFEIDGIRYFYEFKCTPKKIVWEKGYRNKKRKKLVFAREGNEITFTTSEFKDLKIVRLRDNASIISTAHQYEMKCTEAIYSFFSRIFSNVNFFGWDRFKLDQDKLAHFLRANPVHLDFIRDKIRKYDTGVDDIKIFSKKDEKGKIRRFPVFFHENAGRMHKLLLHNESSGTKTLYNELALYKDALLRGGLLVVDEIDVNLHPHIIPELLELFCDRKNNPKLAQVIFTTHNNEIMNYLGKYRTVLTEKRDNESFAFRLDEVPGDILRNDRAISPIYDSGKIGGVPKL